MRHLFSGILLLTTILGLSVSSKAVAQEANQPMLMLQGTVAPSANNQFAAIIDPQKGSYIGSPARITNQSFKISTNLPAATLYVLMIGDPSNQSSLKYYNVFLANEQVELNVPEGTNDVKVTKGDTPLDFAALVQQMGPEFDAMNAVDKAKQSAGTYSYNTDSLDKERGKVVERIHTKVPVYLQSHHSTAVAPFLLNLVWPLNFPLAEVEGWVKMIDEKAMQSDYGLALNDLITTEKMLGYGQKAPIFTQNNPDGKPVDLESFKGKYVLIDFWASWCGPCRMENPNVVRAYEQFKSKNFTVLGVSLDKDKGKWLKAIEDDNLKWTHVSDLGYWNNAVAVMYKVRSIPQNYLLDPDGRIIGKNLRGEELTGFLQKVLASN
jgi:peroxiredoxin